MCRARACALNSAAAWTLLKPTTNWLTHMLLSAVDVGVGVGRGGLAVSGMDTMGYLREQQQWHSRAQQGITVCMAQNHDRLASHSMVMQIKAEHSRATVHYNGSTAWRS
jgi:hypothetical protein